MNISSEQNSLQFSLSKSTPLILQAEIAECGLASMAMIASFYGHELDMATMRKRCSANLKGMNLQNLIELGDSLGLASRPLQCPLGEVHKLQTPCVLHWNLNHFVVLTKVSGKGKSQTFYINDPAQGIREYKLEAFSKHFTGICLELSPTSTFEVKVDKARMKFSQLWSSIKGLKSGLVKLIALSLVMQLFVLMTPYYMQWVVDEVLVSFDESLLVVLALGFALIAILSVITNAVRSWLILRLSSLLNMQMGVNLLHHLLRLPMNYFESRHIGDIVSRFGSLAQIRERITTGFVETLVDGVMSITVLIVMLLYSVKLTAVVLGAMLLYTLVRLVLFKPLKIATEDMIQNSAKEQSHFLESVRGMQTLKLFGQESQRQSIWQNRYSDVINSEIRLGRLNISFDSMNQLLFGLENVLVIYFAATLVMSGSLTVGMVLAFIAYKGQLTQCFANLIEQIIQFKMMRLHLDRISDIALTPIEAGREGDLPATPLKGEITLEDISFRYSDDETFLFEGLNYTFKHNNSYAITGISGSGKTTLMKIMLGLILPTSGRVLIDGIDIATLGLKNYRQSISAVMQDDTLLTGTIGDNITFFSPEPNIAHVEWCTNLASIHEDIKGMTMGYHTMVGDMGASLSGGQIQRILLARALYQDPIALLLDEATSHLDSYNESTISGKLSQLPFTRIMIAHRVETIKEAGIVLALKERRLVTIRHQDVESNFTHITL